MASILLLTSRPEPAPDETAARVPAAFRARGVRCATACIDGLELGPAGLSAAGIDTPVAGFDAVWVLGFGRQETFLDKMQLLAGAAGRVRFVNAIEALLLLHAKYPPSDAGDAFPQPETFASDDAEVLATIARERGGRWVLKPPAGSFGRGVTVAAGGSEDLLRTGQRLTAGGRYALLQRWCPEVEAGEHRVLVAGGGIIGSYARTPAMDADASNLAAGGDATPAAPDASRDALALRAARFLAARGVAFAGLDIAGPWILEANVINPGGIATLERLGDAGAPHRLVDAIIASGALPGAED